MATVNETLVREILDRLIRLETEVTAINRRIDDINTRITETNTRLDNQVGELRRELIKQTYFILATGAAVIAAVLATHFAG